MSVGLIMGKEDELHAAKFRFAQRLCVGDGMRDTSFVEILPLHCTPVCDKIRVFILKH